MKFHVVIRIVVGSLFSLLPLIIVCPVFGQEDPNAQYVVLQSGTLAEEPIEIDVPVEAGVLRLQFSVKYTDRLEMTVINPIGRPLVLSEPNIVVTEQREARTVLVWDPRPGPWKLRLSGSGAYTAQVTVQGELYICCMQFFEGRGISSLERFQPAPGTTHRAQIYASGYSIDRLAFSLIDEYDRPIKDLRFRQSDYSNPYNFAILIEVPDRPFRILATGTDQNGRRFRRVMKWLVAPQASTATENSPGYNPGSQAGIDLTAVAGEQQIIRAEVVDREDRPLLSDKGNQIGIRLTFSMKFPAEGQYAPLPQLYPERIGYGYTGALTLRVQNGGIDPLPEGLSDPGQIAFGARATYKPGTLYRFTVDLVPIYLTYNQQTASYCLQKSPYQQPGIREKFEREIESTAKFRYRISIAGSNLDGRQPALTDSAYQPSLWHRNFVAERIPDCR